MWAFCVIGEALCEYVHRGRAFCEYVGSKGGLEAWESSDHISVHSFICASIKKDLRGAWAAQPVKRPTSAQVMISQSMSSSPASGSVLTAQSLEPASDSVSPSLSDPPPFMLCLSLSQK